MKFTTALLSLGVIGQSLATAAPRDIATIQVPAGYGANGTIVADTEKARKYLSDEAGVDMDKFLQYAGKLSRPQVGVQYPFPAGSGLEGSSVTINSNKALALYGNEDATGVQDMACEECWIICIALSWLPPVWAMCMAGCASNGCSPLS